MATKEQKIKALEALTIQITQAAAELTDFADYFAAAAQGDEFARRIWLLARDADDLLQAVILDELDEEEGNK